MKPILQDIAAKVADGSPCCDWVGREGAGHFVKMVHNGIEYGDIQLICEAYDIMQHALGMKPAEMSAVFAEWNKGELDSYLIEITADILAFTDEDGQPMVDKILDTAGQKGTGKWTAMSALDSGIPLTLIGEAVFARFTGLWRRQSGLAGRSQRRALRVEDRFLHPGLHVDAGHVPGKRLGFAVRRHRPHVARGLHHPGRIPGGHQSRL